ncbi:MAG: ArnT family glycosyltransferase [Chloroflexota bacterium]
MEETTSSFWGKPRLVTLLALLALALGLGIRLFDLTDLPLDFNPTRQLFSAIKARGMYYQYADGVPDWQREMAIEQWQAKADVEPPVIETLTAGLYLLFGEHLWFGRLIASLAWLLGGLALYALARRVASADGALVALLYYLFLDFGVIASRAFQPDPLMVGLTLSALWAFERWLDARTWKWTVAAGLLAGLAIFVKNVAVFPLLGGFALMLLSARGWKAAIKDRQAWALALLTALPTLVYMVNGLYISQDVELAMGLRFFPSLWVDPGFYVRWKNIISNTLGFGPFLLALLGVFLARTGRERALLFGTLLGYLVYGFALSYHISTHNYYQLPLMVFVAPSLAVVGKTLFGALAQVNGRSIWARLAVATILLLGVGAEMWAVRVELVKDDYRAEPQFWADLGDILGHTTPVLGLTQDYGNRLEYWGWQYVDEWPTTGDQNLRELAGKAKTFDEIFADRITGKRYFVITNFNQFERQPDLMERLSSSYPILEQTPEYLIFDLEHPLDQP